MGRTSLLLPPGAETPSYASVIFNTSAQQAAVFESDGALLKVLCCWMHPNLHFEVTQMSTV